MLITHLSLITTECAERAISEGTQSGASLKKNNLCIHASRLVSKLNEMQCRRLHARIHELASHDRALGKRLLAAAHQIPIDLPSRRDLLPVR